MKTLFLKLIGFYRRHISPHTPAACRYRPTCSAYAEEAIRRYGPLKGGWLATKRLLRCHPFVKRDPYDPVPNLEEMKKKPRKRTAGRESTPPAAKEDNK